MLSLDSFTWIYKRLFKNRILTCDNRINFIDKKTKIIPVENVTNLIAKLHSAVIKKKIFFMEWWNEEEFKIST